MKISLIGSSGFRTYFYLKAIKEANIDLNEVILYDFKKLDLSKIWQKNLVYRDFRFSADKEFDDVLKYFNVTKIDKKSINELENEIKKSDSDIFIFSGKGGEIVKENILKHKKILHIHPGKLPEYRGSTTIYYSILNENKIFATAFFLDKKIDSGNVIKTLEFDIIDCEIDYFFDPFIRTYLLIDVLKNSNFEEKKQSNKDSKEYYIIHPVLKKISIQRCKNVKS